MTFINSFDAKLSTWSNQFTHTQGCALRKNLPWPTSQQLSFCDEALLFLSCSHNKLTSLPNSVGCLANLSSLKADHNNLTSLGTELGQLKQLDEMVIYMSILFIINVLILNTENLVLHCAIVISMIFSNLGTHFGWLHLDDA